jgi:hypothetical protein
VTPSAPPERELARRLVVREIGEQDTPTATLAATDRVLRQLDEHLARWFGRDGSRAVLARGLDRARAAHPLLTDATLARSDERLLIALAERARDASPEEVREALMATIAAVIALLTRLIGGDMVARLVRQLEPDRTFERPAHDDTTKTPDEEAPSD